MPRKKKKRLSTEFSNNISIWHKNIPILYDVMYQMKLECPSYSCVFGNKLADSSKNFTKYRIFQSRATNANYLKDRHIWQGLPHALLICNTYIPNNRDIPHSNYPLYQQLSDWNHKEITNYPQYNNEHKHYFEITKRIIHPGPILRIKQMHQFPHIVATHTQHKYVFVWNTSTQHNRALDNNSDPNTPELILKGHKKDAVYALDFSRNNYGVASGSKDNRICVWNIADYQTVLSSTTEPDKKERFVPLSKPSPKLKPRTILKGHSDQVTDVEFAPYSPYILASVSDDHSFKLWDIRCNQNDIYNDKHSATHEIDNNFVHSSNNLHDTEITNLSWNKYQNNYILTASRDGIIHLLDRRKLQPSNHGNNSKHHVMNRFEGHSKRISSLQWNPSEENSNYFLSSSHDGTVAIWDIHGKQKQMIFKHIGHQNPDQGAEVVHSASWINNDHSWSITSTSSSKAFVPFFWSSSSDKKQQSNGNNGNNGDIMSHKHDPNENPNDISEGGIMQIWRPSMLLKMDRNEIINSLKQKKGKRFINDLEDRKEHDDNNNNHNHKENKSKKRKKRKKKKSKSNHNDNDEDNDENMSNNEDIDIQMIDVDND